MDNNLTAFPAWIDGIEADRRPREKMRFILRYAALMATEKGTIDALSEAIGYANRSLTNAVGNGIYDKGLPVQVIKGIEDLLGAGTIPRAMMNPMIYGEG